MNVKRIAILLLACAAEAAAQQPDSSGERNSLLDVARGMRHLEKRIAAADRGSETGKLQRQVVSDLQRLIDQAQRGGGEDDPQGGAAKKAPSQQLTGKPQPGTGNGGQSPNGTPSAGGAGTGGTGPPDREIVHRVIEKLHTELPERKQRQMKQLPPEEFLPGYELLIEEYFRRLAEENDE